jgi:crotonobetainyl-CoA:carnitine CoA-transferase CaiB-like acyl-CoA transferase
MTSHSPTKPFAPPLAGFRVVEMGSSLAGPFAALILRQLGAEVFKVEAAGGDAMRSWGKPHVNNTSAGFETFNHGKRSIVVDLTNADEVAALVRFIEAGVDVVLQNLRPGVAERFGLGSAELTARCPELIYCNQWSFGDRGPMSPQPGYDPLMQAFAGIIDATGEADRSPARVGASIIDMSTGMWGAMGILALLVRRATGSGGGVVDASLLESGLAWMGLNFAALQADGTVPQRGGLQGPLISPNGGFTANDGIIMIVVGTDPQFARLSSLLDLPGLSEDERFATSNARFSNRTALTQELNAALSQKDRAHWASLLNEANIPNAPVQNLAEATEHEQTKALEIVQTNPNTKFSVIGLPLRFDGHRPGYDGRSPALGEHNDDVFGDGNGKLKND